LRIIVNRTLRGQIGNITSNVPKRNTVKWQHN